MGQILKDIYTDTTLAPLLGFKGGTCAFLLYGLPRFSVDLDFDLLSSESMSPEIILKKINSILENYGVIKDSYVKKFTIFALLSYGETDHNIKIEISTRQLSADMRAQYEIRTHLGISLLAAKKEYMYASKLVALTARRTMMMRDIFDIHFFAKQNWDIEAAVVRERTGLSVAAYLSACIVAIEKVKEVDVLHGLGELLDEKQKTWVKKNLKSDTIFLLRNYQSAIQ